MWSMWNAPSDRDYYDPYGRDDEDEQTEYCCHCGAGKDQACEEWCYTDAPASEPASAEDPEPEAPTAIRTPESVCFQTSE
jgi:hypothetical protein